MTFTPQVLSQVDNNNSKMSSIDTSFNGTSTITTGYNTLILTINSTTDSLAGGIQIQFSDDNSTWITPYTDTYFATNIFTKNYLIVKKYYRIIYNNSSPTGTFSITSRLSTDLDSSIIQNTSVSVFDNNVQNTLDAFARLRVSAPTTILDIRFPGQNIGSASFLKNNLQVTDASNGSYTGTYGDSKLIIDASGAGYYISQSRNYCVYQPGKSLLFMASGIIDPSNNNYTTRIGYFDNVVPLTNPLVVRNGIYFDCSGGVFSVNIKNNTTTRITQSNWNIDKLNGTGLSGLTLDFRKTQLFVIDMEWLGVGRVRFGFYVYGKIQYCHQVTNINILTAPYTNSINLPICYSIHSTVGGGRSNNFTQICSTVISEGGYAPLGRPFSIGNGVGTGIGVPLSQNIETPVLFLRGNVANPNYYHQNIIPTEISMICADSTTLIYYRLEYFLAGTYTGTTTPTWTNVNSSYSVAQYARQISNPSTGYSSTNAITLDQGYFYGRGSNTFSSQNDIFTSQILQLTSNITNDSDILVLTATTTSNNTTVFGTIKWQELY
jgi:hypothetical protein